MRYNDTWNKYRGPWPMPEDKVYSALPCWMFCRDPSCSYLQGEEPDY